MSIDRRNFLKSVGAGAAAVAVLPAGVAHAGKKILEIPLDNAPKLKVVKGWAILKLSEHPTPIMFIRKSRKAIRAFHPTCTHKQCTVGYDKDDDIIKCGCHGSRFNLKGKPQRGPAKAPLTRYPARIKGDKIQVII